MSSPSRPAAPPPRARGRPDLGDGLRPAALKTLFEGFGIPISYGRLREACQTDLDGTSIDTMEEAANRLGLEAEQVLVPLDHLLVPEARCDFRLIPAPCP
ncbi:MAG TPA: cysteine peptidase family C39 domain-containing protein [Thermoanaerobaculia bacterium]|nr:cysteine peptidase family C39 domain-containing protein [Thermoanaerobaculia bacterium]